jgi:hypothetical protein
MAATLLEHGDAAEACSLMAQLQPLWLADTDRAQLNLLEGIAHARDRHAAPAQAAFAAAAGGGDPDIAVRAAYLATTARAEDGSAANRAAAVAELAEQRPRWRGHPWESRMLHHLGQLRAGAGLHADAFAAWRAAMAATADPTLTAEIGQEMRRRLAALLADGVDAARAPFEKLALYRAHGQLLGADEAAQAIRVGLAEAAAASGLPETAASLLDGASPALAATEPYRRASRLVAVAALAAERPAPAGRASDGDLGRRGAGAGGDGGGMAGARCA